ncbi:MAG: hypothetical protein KF830_18935, partial [Planctomycetes bacterium]|nr:hypothetical protein [Planctomycetota bacterium]
SSPPSEPSRSAPRTGPQSLDEVTDPKTYPEVQWPAGIDAGRKAELQELAEQATDAGVRGRRAIQRLVQAGYGGMFAIVERLRLLDYKSPEDSMAAFALHKALEEITGGMKTGFQQVEATEAITPAKAQYNTSTVKAWITTLAKFPDEETFQKERAARLQKQADADK